MDHQTKRAIRKSIYVNHEVQGKLIVKNVLHWCFYMSAILLAVCVWQAFQHPDETAIKFLYVTFVYLSPAILASVFLLPLFIYDFVKASHKVVGPIERLKEQMRALANGEKVEHLRFRDGDHWSELAEEFNRVADLISEKRSPQLEEPRSFVNPVLQQAEQLPV